MADWQRELIAVLVDREQLRVTETGDEGEFKLWVQLERHAEARALGQDVLDELELIVDAGR